MFNNFKVFEIYIKRVFEDINAKRTIVRKLINLKQKKVTLIYTT